MHFSLLAKCFPEFPIDFYPPFLVLAYTAGMHIFALETNMEKAARAYLQEGEQELFIIRYHPFLFVVKALRQFLLTLLMVGVAAGLLYLEVPFVWIAIAFAVIWLIFVLPGLVKAFIDWRFDGVVVTNDNVIIIDQTSLFHNEVRQMHLENFASVNASTQFWNLFPFGKICFDLKEGVGQKVCLSYIPQAQRIAFMLSNTIRAFQRSGGNAAAVAQAVTEQA
jgi:hypothetical protein